MKVALKFLCLLMTCVVVASATTTTISSATTEAKIPLDCNRTCGNVEVPYPYGIEDPKCAKDTSFVLNCIRSSSPPQLFVGLKVQVVNISLVEATMSVVIHNVAYACYNESGVSEFSVLSISIGANSPYTFSKHRKQVHRPRLRHHRLYGRRWQQVWQRLHFLVQRALVRASGVARPRFRRMSRRCRSRLGTWPITAALWSSTLAISPSWWTRGVSLCRRCGSILRPKRLRIRVFCWTGWWTARLVRKPN